MRLSILKKILLLTLGLAMPPLLLFGWLIFSTLGEAGDLAVAESSDALRSITRETLRSQVASKARSYDAELAGVQNQVETLARYAEQVTISLQSPIAPEAVWVAPIGPSSASNDLYRSTITKARRMVPLLRDTAERNPRVNLAYIAYQRGGVTSFNDPTTVATLREIAPFDPRTRPWYVAASDAQGTIWTTPYVDAASGELVTTCATPVYDRNNEQVGVLGFDVLLTTLQNDILTEDAGSDGFALLINKEGDILAGPEMTATGMTWDEPFRTANLLESPDLRGVAEGMLSIADQPGAIGLVELTYEGTNVYVAYAPIQSAGMIVALVTPEINAITSRVEGIASGIERGQADLTRQLLFVILGTAIIIGLLGFGLARSLVQPLQSLQQNARRAAAGNLNNLPPITRQTNDEIGELVQTFNQMTGNLRDKIAELEDNARQLGTLNRVSNDFRTILETEHIYAAIPQAVCQQFGFDRAVLYLVDDDHICVAAAAFGGDEHTAEQYIQVASQHPIPLDSAYTEADVVRSRQPIIVNDPWNNPRVDQNKHQASAGDAYVQVPILDNTGAVIGIVAADYFETGQPITQRDVQHLQTFATMVGLTLSNVSLYHNLEQQVQQRTRELRAALERAQLADRRKSDFLASISHELRTPLNAIIGFSSVLLDDTLEPLTATQREDVESIHRNGQSLLLQINTLLDLARIEAGYLDIEPDSVQTATVFDEVLQTAQGLLGSRAVTLSSTIAPHLPNLYTDSNRLRQILLNLLGNAIKFTEQGSITLSAVPTDRMAAQPNADPQPTDDGADTPYVAISVSDTGIGIPLDQQERIFEEYSQVHGQRSRAKGTGLGLSIVRRLVEAQGGDIQVRSIPGSGSTFTFTLPTVHNDLYINSLDPTHTTTGQPDDN